MLLLAINKPITNQDCLGIFGGDGTTMRMSYAGYGSPLVMMLEEGGVVTDCNIRTMEADEPAEIDIRATEIPSNIIMKSHWLADVYVPFFLTFYYLSKAHSRMNMGAHVTSLYLYIYIDLHLHLHLYL